ncbi:efflux RND transporter permease subunit [candidate division KSB1 bacterium]
MNLSESSLRRPVTTLVIFFCFIVVGIISSQLLPLEFLPDLDAPFVAVNIPYPGSTPEEVERQITKPVEEVLATISSVKRMTSNSGENFANVQLEFEWGVDTDIKAIEAKEKIDGIRSLLPDDLERFLVQKFSTSDITMLQLRISSERDLSNSYDMLNRNLKRRIERIDGVSRVTLYGVEKKEIRIKLHLDRVISHKIDLNRFSQILRRSNFTVTAGRITDGEKRFVVRPVGEFKSVGEIDELIVGPNNLRLRDIAEISYDNPELDYGRHLNKRYAIGLDVFKEAGANTVEVTDRIVKEIGEISNVPEMQGINIFYMENLAEGIRSSLNELLKSGLIGALLAIFVLFFFLRELKTTFIVMLAIPFSLLVTMSFMYFMGLSLNILSMMGLMLAVGMLVDNAVVVTESIHRHKINTSDHKKATVKGVKEVSLAVTAGTLTTAIVFLPSIVSASDQIAIYIKHVAMTICIAIGASLINSQTVIPLLTSKIKHDYSKKKTTIIDKLSSYYSKILKWTLSHRKSTIALIFLVLFSIAVPVSIVSFDMFPPQGERRLRLFFDINGTYTVAKVEEAVDIVEKYLFDNEDKFELKSVYTYYTGNFAQSTILLKKDDEAQKTMEQIREEIREELPKLAIANPRFSGENSTGGGESVRILLVGKSSEKLTELSQDISWILSKIEGFKDVRSQAEAGEKEVQVVVNRDLARKYGFSTQQVASLVSVSMRGMNLRKFRDESGEVDIRLEFQEKDKQTIENLRNLPLFNSGNKQLKLASVADFRVRKGPRNIFREDRVTIMGVNANLDGITVNDARNSIREVLNNYNFPPGYSYTFGRRFSNEDETAGSMLVNTLLALVLIYIVMAALFESLLFPAAVWSSILFAIVGVWWFFLFTGTTFSLMAWIGVLILIGVVVNNGIVLIDYISQLRAKGQSRVEAIMQAGHNRLRPILMTAGTTIFSLIPLCIVQTGVGGDDGPPYFPMARAIVGGLLFSTAITLLILPTIYVVLDDIRSWARMVIRRVK